MLCRDATSVVSCFEARWTNTVVNRVRAQHGGSGELELSLSWHPGSQVISKEFETWTGSNVVLCSVQDI